MDDSVLNCPICLEKFDDPVMLPCQHCFCWKCLSTYAKKFDAVCPTCRRSFTMNEIRRNLMLEQILENKNKPCSSKPKDKYYPHNFDLNCPSGSKQRTEETNYDATGTAILTGIGGILIGALGAYIGTKVSSATKRKK